MANEVGLSFDDIISEWGLYYQDGGQGIKNLIKLLQQPSETEKYFPLTPTKDTIIRKATVQMTRVLQAFQKEFTPMGLMTFAPREIPLEWMKIDSKLTPVELQNSWLGFLAEKGLKPEDMPITRFYMEYLITQSDEDFENDEVYAGVRVAPTTGESNDAGENFTGIKSQINTGVSAGTINAVTLGAMPTDPVDVVDYIEAFFAAIGEANRKLRPHLDHIFVSPEVEELYIDGMGTKYNTYYAQVNEKAKLVKKSRVSVVGLPSHAGSDKIWTTPVWNRARYTKNGEQAKVFDIQKVDREVKFLNDHHRGLGFWVDPYIYTNDVELS